MSKKDKKKNESEATQTLTPGEPTQPDLAEAIIKISEGLDKLLARGLNHRAIVVLLQDYTKVSRKNIESVLDGLVNLASRYTK